MIMPAVAKLRRGIWINQFQCPLGLEPRSAALPHCGSPWRRQPIHPGVAAGRLLVLVAAAVLMPAAVAAVGCGIEPNSTGTVVIPSSWASIGRQAFEGCRSLTSVAIPNSITCIFDSAFRMCSNLTSVTIGNRVASIGNVAFDGCSSLASVAIPNSVTFIGNGAFYACLRLTSLTIGSSVASIGNVAFTWCSGLTSVTIPNSVVSIGVNAFTNCSSLTSAIIPTSVLSIGAGAFYRCGCNEASFQAGATLVECALGSWFPSATPSGGVIAVPTGPPARPSSTAASPTTAAPTPGAPTRPPVTYHTVNPSPPPTPAEPAPAPTPSPTPPTSTPEPASPLDTQPTTRAPDPCRATPCVLDCTGSCGWDGDLDRCVTGGFTSALERQTAVGCALPTTPPTDGRGASASERGGGASSDLDMISVAAVGIAGGAVAVALVVGISLYLCRRANEPAAQASVRNPVYANAAVEDLLAGVTSGQQGAETGGSPSDARVDDDPHQSNPMCATAGSSRHLARPMSESADTHMHECDSIAAATTAKQGRPAASTPAGDLRPAAGEQHGTATVDSPDVAASTEHGQSPGDKAPEPECGTKTVGHLDVAASTEHGQSPGDKSPEPEHQDVAGVSLNADAVTCAAVPGPRGNHTHEHDGVFGGRAAHADTEPSGIQEQETRKYTYQKGPRGAIFLVRRTADHTF